MRTSRSSLTESNRRPSPYHRSIPRRITAGQGTLTRPNASPREHRQARDMLTRAQFATQSATHFDLALTGEGQGFWRPAGQPPSVTAGNSPAHPAAPGADTRWRTPAPACRKMGRREPASWLAGVRSPSQPGRQGTDRAAQARQPTSSVSYAHCRSREQIPPPTPARSAGRNHRRRHHRPPVRPCPEPPTSERPDPTAQHPDLPLCGWSGGQASRRRTRGSR